MNTLLFVANAKLIAPQNAPNYKNTFWDHKPGLKQPPEAKMTNESTTIA